MENNDLTRQTLRKELKLALKEVKEEKTRPIEELIQELNLEKDMQN